MTKERLDLELMRSEIQEQSKLLEKEKKEIKEGRHKLDSTKAELEKKKEHADSLFDEIDTEKANIKHLTLQVQTKRNQLEHVMNMITLKQQEQELKEDELTKRKQELVMNKNTVLTERGELDVLRKDLNKKKEEVEAAMNSITREREQLSKMKADNEKEKEMILIEKDRIEVQCSELKMRQDQLVNEMKSIQTLRRKLQQLNERIIEDMKNKMDNLQQRSEDVQMLYTVLEEKVADLDGEKEKMAYYTELLEREKEVIAGILSDVVTQRQDMENQCKQGFELEKQDLEKLKAVLKQEREDLDRVHEIMTKERLELETSKNSVLTERGELEVLGKDLKKKKEEVDIAMNSISGEREQLSKMKTDNDKEREVLLIERDRIEVERSEVKIKEDQVMKIMKSMETMKVKLQQLNNRISEDMKNKMDSLQQNCEGAQILYATLEQMFAALDGEKEKMAFYTELLEREKEGIAGILSDVVTQRRDMENQWKQGFELEKQDLEKVKAVLKQEKGDLDRVNNLKMMRSDIQKQCDLLEKEKKDIKEEKDQFEIIETEQQCQREDIDSHIDEIKHDKQELYQMKTTIEKKRMEEDLSKLKMGENQLTSLMISIGSLRAKFKQLNQRINEDFRKHMDRLEQKHGDIVQLKSILELKFDELDKQKNKIIGYCDLIQRDKKYVVTMKVDMAVQTEVVAKVLQEEDPEKQDLNKLKDFDFGKDGLQAGFAIQTEELEHQWRLEEDKRATLSESAVEEEDFTDEGMSKRDYLRNIWKDTKTERKEIDQMKRRGHEMRNNLEKRLTVINQFIQRTLFQKEKEPLEKRSLKQGSSNDTTSQSDCNSKALDKKYMELQQLKIQMLSEIEKLHVKEKVSRTLTTSNKANQTSQVHITTEDAIVQVSEEASTKMYQEPEAAPETTSGLLCQLRHYCYRCYCPCCACCKQVCPEEK
ncbi:centriolin-like isoform X2 [Dicentrarchus labrax]|nr:centriolin-like isoform X2 [Dicentrarchus labrax]